MMKTAKLCMPVAGVALVLLSLSTITQLLNAGMTELEENSHHDAELTVAAHVHRKILSSTESEEERATMAATMAANMDEHTGPPKLRPFQLQEVETALETLRMSYEDEGDHLASSVDSLDTATSYILSGY
eukprot:jgi/Mesen1/3268/ME000019S02686